jgi:hypothetical protein
MQIWLPIITEEFTMDCKSLRHFLIAVVAFTTLFLPPYCVSGASAGEQTVVQSEESASSQAVTPVAEHTHDLAIVSIKVPKKVTLSAKKPTVVKTVKVAIQNRSAYLETIPDQNTLTNLVSLSVVAQSTGSGCSTPVAVLHAGKRQPVLPVTLKPNKKLKVVFDVTFTCAIDPLKGSGHEDFHYIAQVDASALDGQEDIYPDSDVCPRAPVPVVDGSKPDKGCGGKLHGKIRGGPVLSDVIWKGTPADTGGPPPTQVTLECQTKGYPCSLSEVPLSIIEESDNLADSALAMLDNGASAVDVAAWLEMQPGMAEVQSGDLAVRFRLGGGRGTWVLLEGATAPLPEPGLVTPLSTSAPTGITLHKERIVAEDHEQKQALVLSPFLYEFGAYDDGEAVHDILANTRGYEGGVKYFANEKATDTKVGVENFEDWGNYQVVLVTTHGVRACDAGGCRGEIAATTLEAILPGSGQTRAEKTKSLEQQGLEVVKSKHHPGTTFISVTADFMRSRYPSGLDNTVVFLNACQSFASQAVDLVEALEGDTSVVFGWDESVYANDAYAASVALFNELSAGYPTEVAYERLENLRFGTATPHGPPPTLYVSSRPAGGDLRIREVVTLLEPHSGLKLSPSSFVLIDGVEDDGLDDRAPYAVRVDGMTPELAENAVLHVSIDDVQADPVTVSEGVSDDKDQWTFEGVIPLGYDLTAETGVTYRAWVELPDEGESKAETPATLTGEEPIMGRTWELTAVDTAYRTDIPQTPQVSTAHLILSFEPGQEASEPNPRYRITGGTVHYDSNFEYGGCTFSGGVTFDVTDEIADDSHLTFITGTSPAMYWGYLQTLGPEFTRTYQCPDGDSSTSTDVATSVWMYLPQSNDAQEVSADNRTITGEYDKSSEFYFFTSQYTIKRLD